LLVALLTDSAPLAAPLRLNGDGEALLLAMMVLMQAPGQSQMCIGENAI
jgi:hypothetical protein